MVPGHHADTPPEAHAPGASSGQPSGSAFEIEWRGVSKSFAGPDGRDVAALQGIDLGVRHGETLCLIGTSGSGKTTLLRLANRLEQADAGVVSVRGRAVADWDPIALRRSLGYVIQSGGLFPHLSVADNIGLLCRLEGWEPGRTRRRAHELLELVQLPPDEFAGRRPAALSGGQRQRVGVARALALDPPALLMDEPFGALDPITRQQLRDDFLHWRQAVGKTVLLVTHDLDEAFALGDRVALLDAGRLVQVGSQAQLRDEPADDFVVRFLGGQMTDARSADAPLASNTGRARP